MLEQQLRLTVVDGRAMLVDAAMILVANIVLPDAALTRLFVENGDLPIVSVLHYAAASHKVVSMSLVL